MTRRLPVVVAWRNEPGDGAPPRSVFRAATKVGHIGACRVTGKKADDEAETGCTDGERKLRICHGPLVINSRHAGQTDLRASADFVSVR